MIRKLYSIALVAITTLLTFELPAWAGDPKNIGKHVEDVTQANAKPFWRVGALVVALTILFIKPRGALVAAMLISLLVSGMIIYNPGGLGSTVNSLANSIL